MQAQCRARLGPILNRCDASHKPWAMRCAAIEWMIDVHHMFEFDHDSTLFHAVSFFDRFLSSFEIDDSETMLLALVSVSLAVKLHESKHYRLRDLARVTDGACTAEQALKAEVKLMQGLEHRLAVPTVKVRFWSLSRHSSRAPNRERFRLSTRLQESPGLSLIHI